MLNDAGGLKNATCKPCTRPKPYEQKPKAPIPKDAVRKRTAATPVKSKKHKNLTLQDWMVVFAFMDEHPHISQGDVVRHFAAKKDGILVFDQSTLSRKVKARWHELEKITSYPNALSSKHPRVVMKIFSILLKDH